MGKDKNTLTIKDWFDGKSLELEVGGGYMIVSRSVGGKQSNKLSVSRKSDKHSNRIGLMAYLRRNKPGYETLGFPEITLTIDKYADDGQFLSRKIIVFSPVGVDSLTPNNGDETIEFAFGAMSEMTVSKNGVTFN
jgi:hypothetical protein